MRKLLNAFPSRPAVNQHFGSANGCDFAVPQVIKVFERQPSARFVIHHYRAHGIPRHFPANRGRRNVSLAKVRQELDVYEEPVSDYDQRFHVMLEKHFEVALEARSLVVRVGKNRYVGRLIKRVLDPA